MINLGVQGSFGKRLLQLVEQPVLRKGCPRVGIQARQKLIKQLRLLPSRHTMSPSFPSIWPSHEISDKSSAYNQTANEGQPFRLCQFLGPLFGDGGHLLPGLEGVRLSDPDRQRQH